MDKLIWVALGVAGVSALALLKRDEIADVFDGPGITPGIPSVVPPVTTAPVPVIRPGSIQWSINGLSSDRAGSIILSKPAVVQIDVISPVPVRVFTSLQSSPSNYPWGDDWSMAGVINGTGGLQILANWGRSEFLFIGLKVGELLSGLPGQDGELPANYDSSLVAVIMVTGQVIAEQPPVYVPPPETVMPDGGWGDYTDTGEREASGSNE